MKFCTFSLRGGDWSKTRVGSVTDEGVFEAPEGISMQDLLDGGAVFQKKVKWASEPRSLSSVRLAAPLPRPRKILAAIVNTKGMLGGSDVSLDRPRIDMKAPSAVIGPGETVKTRGSGVRPEVELAAVIGKRVSGAKPRQAGGAIFGYTILNDMTAPKDSREDAYEAYRRDPKTKELRRVTLRGPLFRSKNHDTFCPMGPWIVTADELGPSPDLRMTTRFRGRLLQDGRTSDYIFSPEALVAYISSFLTLEPGDVVSCGSVGWTKEALGERDPTEFVCTPSAGYLELEVEAIGVLRNRLS
ncbi:MAG TPA: fumarylacetoacetate hydrolase family protein [Nitrososphaerales archaeon]|nr:fumarylacetoacetate hydrolase family protein [Nitrososphaerales archaeon]